MALCVYCRKETELYDGGTPVCVDCSDAHDGKLKKSAPPQAITIRLQREVAAATERADAANAAFHTLIREVPSSTPHPDGSQRLHNASRELTMARQAMMEATLRLNNFLNHGTTPDDLS